MDNISVRVCSQELRWHRGASIAEGRCHKGVGEDVTDAEEKKVLAMRARLSKAGVLRPIPYDCRA